MTSDLKIIVCAVLLLFNHNQLQILEHSYWCTFNIECVLAKQIFARIYPLSEACMESWSIIDDSLNYDLQFGTLKTSNTIYDQFNVSTFCQVTFKSLPVQLYPRPIEPKLKYSIHIYYHVKFTGRLGDSTMSSNTKNEVSKQTRSNNYVQGSAKLIATATSEIFF